MPLVVQADSDGAASAAASPDVVAGTYRIRARQSRLDVTGPWSAERVVVVPMPSGEVLHVPTPGGGSEPLEVLNPGGYHEYVRV